jgi:hypothetical protein
VTEFFTEADLALLVRYQGRAYRANAHQPVKKALDEGGWGKTSFWARNLDLEGWRVNMRRLVVTGWGLNDEDQKVQGSIFQHYTWASLTPVDTLESRVFFTVGIEPRNGEGALVYKLDCQSHGGPRLADAQVARFRRLLAQRDPTAHWRTISARRWPEYNWPRLLEETRRFILDRMELYHDLVAVVLDEAGTPVVPGIRPSKRPAGAPARSYLLPEQPVESADEHRRLQYQLVDELRREYPGAAIYCEGIVEPEGWFVDVVRQESNRTIIYEIKTDPRLHLCIRNAVGQLLQYAYWGQRQLADELVIVSRHTLDNDARNFLLSLQGQFNIPISYRQVVSEL